MRGFTLIEITTVLSLFMMISLIVFNIITLSNRIYLHKEQSTEILQNGRVILDSISREIRQSKGVVTDLPSNRNSGKKEIIFQDGHVPPLREQGDIREGEGLNIYPRDGDFSANSDSYSGVFIKIYNPHKEDSGEIGVIAKYNADEEKIILEKPLKKFSTYSDLNYVIDSNNYYISYFLEEKRRVKREVFAYHFSGDSTLYVPHNGVPPEGETLEKEILEYPRVIGEYIDEISFWNNGGIGIYLKIVKGEKVLNLINTVSSRNI